MNLLLLSGPGHHCTALPTPVLCGVWEGAEQCRELPVQCEGMVTSQAPDAHSVVS